MVSQGRQCFGFATALTGWLGVIVTCVLPQWRMGFIGTHFETAKPIWEGLWMECLGQNTATVQCHTLVLEMPEDLQGERVLTIISIITGTFGIVLAMVGGKCTNCIEDPRSKAKVGITAGLFFVISGLLCLTAVSWSAHRIIQDFNNPLVPSLAKKEISSATYIGWASSILLLLGGALLCCYCPAKKENHHTARFIITNRTSSSPQECE